MSTMFAEELARVEGKVRKYVAENRVRLESFFVVYDRLRHRHISRAQFFRGLNVAMNNMLLLSPEEEQALADKYGRDDGQINYRAFSDSCTLIQRDLEKSPWAEVRNEHQSTNMRRNQLSPGEEKYFYSSLLPKLQKIAREQGLVVKNAYFDFDHNKNGCVTKMQFLRGLPDKFQIACSRSDLEMLVDRYSLPDAYGTGVDVSYHTMHIDVSEEDPALTLPDGRPDDVVEVGWTAGSLLRPIRCHSLCPCMALLSQGEPCSFNCDRLTCSNLAACAGWAHTSFEPTRTPGEASLP